MFENGLQIPTKEIIKEWLCFILFIVFGGITCAILFPISVVSYLLRVKRERSDCKHYYKIDDNIKS